MPVFSNSNLMRHVTQVEGGEMGVQQVLLESMLFYQACRLKEWGGGG